MSRFQLDNTPHETFSWSYTKFRDSRTCLRKLKEVTIDKNFKEEYSDALREGDSLHGAFERYVSKGAPLPTGWKYLQDWADDAARKITQHQITRVAAEYGITRDFKPTGYYANNVWLRVKLDQLDLFPNGDKTLARVIDFKNGTPKDDPIQLAIYAAVVFIHYPDVIGVRTEYWWIKIKEKTHELFRPEDIKELWAELLPELAKMEEAQEKNSYPPRKNGLCKAYCPVTTCEYNGKRS